jgi:mono/diheme cytochrome c family protein
MRTILQVTGLAALLAAVAIGAGAVHAQTGQGDPLHGAELYATNCAVCHGAHGEGRIGATLNKVFATIAPDEFLSTTIAQGVKGTFMPTWGQQYGGPLTDADIADLVAYITSWGTAVEPPAPPPPRAPENIPPVPEVNGDPNAGFVIFEQNCVACHGEGGVGRIGATLDTTFPALHPGAFALTTISNGVSGTLMPAWSQANGGPLTDQQINDVAAYVLSIQKSAAAPPGGEQVQQNSALPLLLVGVATLVVIVALGVAVSRKPASGGPPTAGGE